MSIEQAILHRVESQMSRADIVLFTGAGFSLGASDSNGGQLPGSITLAQELWELCFSGEPFEEGSQLDELFHSAMQMHRTALRALLRSRLSVDAESLPDYYKTWFDQPWHRYYTLNVDDLEMAISRKFSLPRQILPISATSDEPERAPVAGRSEDLEAVHLNGIITDDPELLTFSPTQYAERIARSDPWYARCVADIMSRPVVFVGTRLDELPLWTHLALRKERGPRGTRELRPGSLLVAPSLTRPRQNLLRELNIDWIAMGAEEFAETILTKLSEFRDRGHELLQRTAMRGRHGGKLESVGELASIDPNIGSEYLLGQEPIWADIHTGRAAVRSDDEKLYKTARSLLKEQPERKSVLAITGTAGCGKSTSLMRLVLRLFAEGTPVLWVDRDSDAGPRDIREAARAHDEPFVIAIDDADVYGHQLTGLARELPDLREKLLVMVAVRSSKLERLLDPSALGTTLLEKHAVPNLTDDDIDAILEVLEREHRLGVLHGRSEDDRRAALREQAGRQLLVAMIQATSGKRFEEKVTDELLELPEDQKFIYALVSMASSFRHFLTQDEILLASGDTSNVALNALASLVGSHLIVCASPTNRYRTRHRLIADQVVDALVERGYAGDVLRGLAWASASRVNPATPRHSRDWRLLKRTINHKHLMRMLRTIQQIRPVYELIQELLHWDYHYWLQRGSVEVEIGDLSYAENFLGRHTRSRRRIHSFERSTHTSCSRRAVPTPKPATRLKTPAKPNRSWRIKSLREAKTIHIRTTCSAVRVSHGLDELPCRAMNESGS